MPGLFDRLQGELEAQQKAAGLTMADILNLPDQLRKLVNWMMREEQVSFSQILAQVDQGPEEVRAMLTTLIEKGFVREIPVKPEPRYQIRLGRKRKQQMPLNIWDTLVEKTE